MEPIEALPVPVLVTLQITMVLSAPVTVAWNCCVWPSARDAEAGLMVTTAL